MIDALVFVGAYAVPLGLVLFATRRALRQIDAQYERAVEATR